MQVILGACKFINGMLQCTLPKIVRRLRGHVFSIADIPLYDADVQQEETVFPATVEALAKQDRQAGFVWVTSRREYNYGTV